MPYRKILLLNNHYYHIFNHSFGKTSIFGNFGSPTRILKLWDYYRFKNIPMSYSKFIKLTDKLQLKWLNHLKKKNSLSVEIIAFCLMPNHYHLLLKQVEKNGIKKFVSNSQNGYAKYFNIKNERVGQLFKGRFQSVSVNTDAQLLHLNRYIHLNPYSSKIIKNKEGLFTYPWSSFPQYLDKEKGFCQSDIILDQFENLKAYQDFVLNQADYQQKLDLIKHLTLE